MFILRWGEEKRIINNIKSQKTIWCIQIKFDRINWSFRSETQVRDWITKKLNISYYNTIHRNKFTFLTWNCCRIRKTQTNHLITVKWTYGELIKIWTKFTKSIWLDRINSIQVSIYRKSA